jgi:hypothetical protein
VFWSKIWFFLVAAAAVLGVGAALTMPRPAERKVLESEDARLDQAMESVRLYLMLEARGHVDLALLYARHEIYVELKKIKDDEANAEAIAQQLHDSAQATLASILAKTKALKPQMLIALDAWGRVVARAGLDEKEWGDDLSGYWLVRDALRGSMRDDLWVVGGKLYRVAAAPVIAQPAEGVDSYVGALVVGYAVDEAVASNLARIASSRRCGGDSAEACDTHVAFFARGETIANSGPTTAGSSIKAEIARRDGELTSDRNLPLDATGEGAPYRVFAKRLPGEAGAEGGVYAVYAERPRALTAASTLSSITRDDLAFGNFPWTLLGGGFIAALAIGLLLMWAESDRPLKRLVRDALAVGKGEKKNLGEDLHRRKYGSIARSVNLALDKLARDKVQRRDLGALYTTDDSAPSETVRPLPAAGPMGPPPQSWSPPPPSDFVVEPGPSAAGGSGFDYVPPAVNAGASFDYNVDAAPPPVKPLVRPGVAATTAGPSPLAPSRVAPQSPMRSPRVPAPLPPPPTPLSNVDDDLLPAHDADEAQLVAPPPSDGRVHAAASSGLAVSSQPHEIADASSGFLKQQATAEGEDAYFRQVYEDFIELKRKCGEQTESLTFEKFLVKLRQNRDHLIAKYACKAVRFQVYVKDGKAALKATPVKG